MVDREPTPLGTPIEVGGRYFDGDQIERFRKAGYGHVPQPGNTPALLVVDVTYEFCGRKPRDLEAPAKASGASAWDAISKLEALIPLARKAGVPVIFSKNKLRTHPVEIGGWGRKASPQAGAEDLEIVAEIAPTGQDLVVEKTKPSAFFATPLASWLMELNADTIFLAGGTTSGCVRATVTDAFSYNLRTFVVHDAVFDRDVTSHEVNLFEMQQKYAGLVTTESLMAWLEDHRLHNR